MGPISAGYRTQLDPPSLATAWSRWCPSIPRDPSPSRLGKLAICVQDALIYLNNFRVLGWAAEGDYYPREGPPSALSGSPRSRCRPSGYAPQPPFPETLRNDALEGSRIASAFEGGRVYRNVFS